MVVVRGTRKFLDRLGRPLTEEVESTGVLGDWYANPWFWRPQAALFVNERSLLPVVLPLAPARSVLARFPAAFEEVTRGLGVGGSRLDDELADMAEHALAKTASRSVLGVMNEFAHMADAYRSQHEVIDLVGLSLWLAHVPCSPLYKSHITPDRALLARLG